MKFSKVQKIANSYGKTLNILNSCGILPFVWCEAKQRMILKRPPKLWTLFQLTFVVTYVIFLIVQSVRIWRNEDSSLFDCIYVPFFTLGAFLFLANVSIVHFNSVAHPQFVNNLLKTTKGFYGKDFSDSENETSTLLTSFHTLTDTNGKDWSMGNEKTIARILATLRTFVFLTLPIVQGALPIVRNPASPVLFTSLLPKPVGGFLLMRLVIGSVQFYIFLSHFGMLAYHCSTLALLFFLPPGILKNMR